MGVDRDKVLRDPIDARGYEDSGAKVIEAWVKGDSHPRLRVTPGAILFGSGSAAPTSVIGPGGVTVEDITTVDDLTVGDDLTVVGDILTTLGSITGASVTATGAVTGADLAATDDLTVGDDASVGGDLAVTGAVTAASATATGTVQGADLVATDDLTVGDDATITGDLAVTGATTSASVTATGLVQGADVTATDDLVVGDDATITGDLAVAGAITNNGLPIVSGPITLFDHFVDAGNVSTDETDLYSDIIPAGRLAANGQKLMADYAGVLVQHATATRRIKVYFGGSVIFETPALVFPVVGTGHWVLEVTLVRVSATVIRVGVVGILPAISDVPVAFASYTEVTGLTLSATNILKVTGEADDTGAASNDIVAKLGTVIYHPAA